MELIWTGDLGNSGFKVCAFRGEKPGPVKRFYHSRKLAEAAVWLKRKKAKTIHAVCANPKAQRDLKRALSAKGIALSVVDKKRPANLSFQYDFNSLGMDRLCDAVAARADYPEPNLIILDFGTALTVNVVEGRVFTGGFIVPGCQTLLDSLSRRAPALPDLSAKKHGPQFARTTRDAILSGTQLLFFSGITGLLVWILKERRKEFRIIATGGGASGSKALPFPVTRDDSLTLRGVKHMMAK